MNSAQKGVKIMKYNCEVFIVDEIMGRGKSWAAINYINSHDDQKYLYITPYLQEINERIIPNCPDKNFVMPEDKYGTKTRHLKMLMNRGKNIASTHALFSLFDQELIDICRSQNYTLIMDEVSNVVEKYDIKSDDAATLLEKYVDVDPQTKLLNWKPSKKNYNGGKFSKEKRLCDLGCLAKYDDEIVVWLFPIQAFNAFDKIYILTYMFEAQIQKYYYDYYELEYSYLYVNGDDVSNYRFSATPEDTVSTTDYKSLIHICDNVKLNAIGNLDTDLSKSWYMRNCQSENVVIKRLKDNMFNYFHNIMRSPTANNLWTCFKDYKKYISGKGYGRGYIPSNLRATNDYRNRNVLAYPINKYINVFIKNYFTMNGVAVDEDGYALSEMLQWIWRSAIRDGKEIWIYIPSRRMRELLITWIDEVSNTDN